ncbi:hypothetical protein SAMN05216603_11144 [Pseudomonas benzenivorans]|jgi:hypothetical protein|nr:hypothetical protein [Pseudomonas benzenivorans]SDH62176.1 hypothetical protein SAMN05216603_11144 [Pseudomonas benzenivorans]
MSILNNLIDIGEVTEVVQTQGADTANIGGILDMIRGIADKTICSRCTAHSTNHSGWERAVDVALQFRG